MLDHLISYLRLAMNRGQSDLPGLAGELALIRALVALREAEHGMSIDMDVLIPDARSHARSGPLFLTVSALLDEAISAGARAVTLTLAAWDDHVGVALAIGTISITPVRTVALADAVAKLLPAGRSRLQGIFNAGANEYVVKHVCQ
ncbi:hypothetical protein CR152_26645 [Massilia violaceinigra]|uniref:Uncharacterized protein n=1 Tax=Massilia violaceinigra TaxID=2045208 RepID=A0A2D2DRT0_9BURK|nr:hypothetical protein [Massilia violaceinigra]ATQ77686.1 hypothetical protein CR152_26645 [Massilia violaceinigra]